MSVKKKPSKLLRKMAAELALKKLELAKKSVGASVKIPAINVRPSTAQEFFVRARVIETESGFDKTFLARVPVTLTTIPEIPEVIKIEGNFFVLTDTLPVTYTQKQYAEAIRI